MSVGLIDALTSIPPVFVALASVLGLLVGSFLNVVIHRLPKMMEREWREQCAEFAATQGGEVARSENQSKYNLVAPRSACPSCGHRISAIENVPVFSYLALRGRCRSCGAKISPRYPVVEAITGLLSGLIAWHFGFGLAGI
ncbi:MAG: prepilin peptidase, partial [Pseudomonadota bacterium]|nr:prepilin peptidase [Pseudomonadota bacterium]